MNTILPHCTILGAAVLAAAQALAAPVTVVTTAKLEFGWSSAVGGDWSAAARAPGDQAFGDVDMGNGISRNGSTPAGAIQSSNAPITSLGNGQTFSMSMDRDPVPQGNQFDLRSSVTVTNGTQNVQASPANVFRYRMRLEILNPYGDLGAEAGAFIGTTFYIDTAGMPNGSHNAYWVMEWRAVVSDGARKTQHWDDSTRFNAHTYSPTGSTAIGQFTDTGVFTGSLSGSKALPEAPFGFSQSWLNFDTYLTGYSADDAGVGAIDFFMDIAVSDTPFMQIPRDGGPGNAAPEPGTVALALLGGSLAWAARRRRPMNKPFQTARGGIAANPQCR
ncbi:MAG: PEP-CTERM sorting domain-containing protein [Burkholderiales bacterium]|nr:PEP-CTERM sorting domain-containing protein [Burkholderiales bacterium]